MVSRCSPENNQDFFDLLNFPESPEHQASMQLPCEPTTEETPSTPTQPGNTKTFRKDVLKLMMEGIKISLVRISKKDRFAFIYLLLTNISAAACLYK